MTTTTMTNETIALNAKLQIKKVGGLEFRVNSFKTYVMNPRTYALFIDGLGYLKFKNEDCIYTPARAALELIRESGLLDYGCVEFVQPIK